MSAGPEDTHVFLRLRERLTDPRPGARLDSRAIELLVDHGSRAATGPVSRLADGWLAQVGGTFIPFDLAARRKMAHENCPELIPLVLRHSPRLFDD